MWLIVSFFAQIIYKCWWYIASSANALAAWVWSGVSLPLEAVVHII